MKKNTKITKANSIRIDLNQFKLHIDLKKKIELTLHFNSPSRKFYLSLIALLVNEMKRLGKITSIPLEGYLDLLALLNETIGGAAGSSEKEHLLPRIYRKWKDALPNLEEAPLFKVIGRRKEYDEGTVKTYPFTESEKDNWANLFEYKGSEENVRLKFAIDKIGASLDDVDIIYEDSLNGEAWEKFLLSLKEKVKTVPETEAVRPLSEPPEILASPSEKMGISWQLRHRWILVTAIVLVMVAGTLAIWGLYIHDTPKPEVPPKENIAFLKDEKSLPVAPPSTEIPAKEKRVEKVSKTESPPPPKVEIAPKEKMASPLPEKPSIAVLPFVNMNKDPEQEFFSDGMIDEIITTLSKSPFLFVAARTSTFSYKGKSIRVDQAGQQLGVRYVLEGSVRRVGDQIRISVQLIDAKTGHHKWAERYDGNMKDVLAIQDEIASKIMKTLQVKLGVGSSPSETRGGSKNPEAYLKSVEATDQISHFTRDGITRARQLFEEVIALEPDFSRGYSGLALSYGMGVMFGMSKSPRSQWHRRSVSRRKPFL